MCICFGFALLCFTVGKKKNQHHLLKKPKVKQKPIPTCSQSFRAWRRLHVFACRSEWFIALFVSVEIGKSQREIYSLNSQKYINYVLIINYVMYYILVRVIAFVSLSRHLKKPL